MANTDPTAAYQYNIASIASAPVTAWLPILSSPAYMNIDPVITERLIRIESMLKKLLAVGPS